MATTHGPFSFGTQGGADALAFNFADPVGAGLQPANTSRRWSHDTDETSSAGVGPTSGQGGNPDGYVYTEMSSSGALNDVFTMEFGTALDAASENWEIEFYTNQRGATNDATCQVQINESGGGWVNVGAQFGGSGDPDKVDTGGVQIWTQRTVDLSNLGANIDPSTLVRLLLTMPAAGTTWHNDYGIDTVTITGVDFVAVSTEQEGFRFRNDDGSESAATYRQVQDTNDQAAKLETIRLRMLTDVTGNPIAEEVTLQVKRDDEDATQWRDV